jgi:predicted nucleic acid-binding protein
MNDRAFIDTNVFIYLQRSDVLSKKKIAETAINTFDCVVSTQVLNEICTVLTKKYPTPIADIEIFLQDIKENCDVSVITEATIDAALTLHDRLRYSYYDCLIVAAALESDCDYLLTEDLQDGQVIDGLTIRNIFAGELT